MKVLLISHPRKFAQKPDFPPIGIAYLGAAAREAGHDVLLIDAEMAGTIANIMKQAKRFMPEFIGVTCWTIDRAMVWDLCQSISEHFPNVFLALGGPHATMMPEHILQRSKASAVVIGEGEETLKDLLACLESGSNLSTVNGLVFRNEDGTFKHTGPRLPIQDLDTISFPYYAGFKNFSFANYLGFPPLPNPTAAVITSRGCVFNCTYCSSVRFWGNRWRYRSAENVLAELQELIEDMGVRSIYFFDDNFPVNKSRVYDICQGIIRKNWNIQWACCSHVKMVDKQMLHIMRSSGCVSIDFGVESGSDKILLNINKKQTRKDIERTFAMVNEAGIMPRAYLMVGNTGEDTTTIDETIEMISRIKPRSSIGASILWLLPGTDSYAQAVQNGFITDDFWLKFDEVPYNLQEHSYKELVLLRRRLMFGIARSKKSLLALLSFYLKDLYYRYPFLSRLRRLVPNALR